MLPNCPVTKADRLWSKEILERKDYREDTILYHTERIWQLTRRSYLKTWKCDKHSQHYEYKLHNYFYDNVKKHTLRDIM